MINTLIKDIYAKVTERGGWFTPDVGSELGREVSQRLQIHFGEQSKRGLRLSAMGPRCPRALWYSVNQPELAEELPPQAIIKYSYGHILEALVIALSKASGHSVVGEQDEINVDGITGHRDCVIDGCIVDVKSASSISFKKFADRSIAHSDSFGYLDQLDGYLVGSLSDPLVTNKDTAYLLAIDKTLGHMCLYEHRLRKDHILDRVREYKGIVDLPSPPGCNCTTVPDGKSGNVKLDTKASYSAYKYCCFPNLRTFLYASGPVYLTKVVRKPDVIEVDKNGKIVYN